MQYTNNYQLPTWVKEDRIMMDDFNNMTAKIDAALGEHQTKLNGFGNCDICYKTYIGNYVDGGPTALTLTFSGPPLVVMVFDNNGTFVIAAKGMSQGHMHNLNNIMAQWSGNSVILSYSNQPFLNTPGQSYLAVALLEKK